MPPFAPLHILAYRADHRLSIPSLLRVKRTASELRLEHTIRPEGRPPKLRN